MKLQEKKYRVSSFVPIQKILKESGAIPAKEIVSTHYYGEHNGNDVEKFVDYADHCEIHILTEQDGRFTMTEHMRIADKTAGFLWLKDRGYTTANIVKMDYTEYAYKKGTVGLYGIDDFLHSVILNFPEGQHEVMEKEFGLQMSEKINVPYNKYLKQVGRLRSITL